MMKIIFQSGTNLLLWCVLPINIQLYGNYDGDQKIFLFKMRRKVFNVNKRIKMESSWPDVEPLSMAHHV